MGLLTNKVVLIVGAGNGIGRAAALACARAGAHVVGNDLGCDLTGAGRDEGVIAALGRELSALGAEHVLSAADVTDDATPEQLVELARTRFGQLDALFVSPGIVRERALTRLEDDDLDRVLDVHLRSPIRLARAATRLFVAQQRGGAILLTTSQAAFVGARGQTAYAAAAAGITGFTRAAALELRRHDLRINALAPLAKTRATEGLPMFQSVRDDSLTPDHVAAAVVHLLSPAASEVSGEVIGVAGSRVYSLRLHETTGAFLPGRAFSSEELAQAWATVTRG